MTVSLTYQSITKSEVISTSPGKLNQAEENATSPDTCPARRRNVRSEQAKVPVAGSTWGGGCCQVQIEQGPRALSTEGGEFHGSPRRAAKNEKKPRSRQASKQASKAKQASRHARPPPGSRHCFMIPGAGPWVRGFHVCAGQLGSDRATAHDLLHRAIFLTSSINHQAWAP